jgi:hypothetical protein
VFEQRFGAQKEQKKEAEYLEDTARARRVEVVCHKLTSNADDSKSLVIASSLIAGALPEDCPNPPPLAMLKIDTGVLCPHWRNGPTGCT